MRPTVVLLTVLASALALMVCACGSDGESRAPTTTIPGEPVQLHEDEIEVDKEDSERNEGGKKEGKEVGKDRGKGKGDDSD